MGDQVDRQGSAISRRELLKRVGFVGTAASIPVVISAPLAAASQGALPVPAASAAPALEAVETLSAAEFGTLEAVIARLIPADDSGPGAVEARAGHYIDRALGGALATSREAYRTGLAALERYAQTSRGTSFEQLSPADQDTVLGEVETNVATGFTPDSSTFFNLVRAHTIQGTFCDPYYGGNANFVGWDLIGYPGVRLAVTPEEQRLDAQVPPTHRSAYDYPMFSGKKPARARLDVGEMRHGD